MGVLPFEQEVVERSTMHEFDSSLHVRLPTPEDLVIMKAIAHRPKDLQDIQIIADKYPNLDKARIESKTHEEGILGTDRDSQYYVGSCACTRWARDSQCGLV